VLQLFEGRDQRLIRAGTQRLGLRRVADGVEVLHEGLVAEGHHEGAPGAPGEEDHPEHAAQSPEHRGRIFAAAPHAPKKLHNPRMLERDRSLAVIGCGTMGEAIVGGVLRAGWLPAPRITVTTRRKARADELVGQYGIHATTDNVGAMRDAELVVLALKPSGVLDLIASPEVREALVGKLVVSIAAGVRLSQLVAALPGASLVRAMPNTPCVIGQGMTVLARADGVDDVALESVARVFRSVGGVVELEDRHMDAVTSLNGSGPAFVYVMLEAMADGGVMMGLPRDVAIEIVASVFRGSAAMVLDTKAHPAALKDEVTTPAGCTIAGLLTMEDGRIRSVLARTIQEATKVASQLGCAK
jgi:pyrroline-5-carboxylate reductase